MSPGGQCHLEANVFFQKEANVREVNVGEANVIAPFILLYSNDFILTPENQTFSSLVFGS